MLMIECNHCRTKAFADCACPVLGHDPAASGAHHPQCMFADLGALVACPPGSGCCDGTSHPGLSHDQSASACPQGHSGPCPEPSSCAAWTGQHGGTPPGDCPGGHCHQDAPGCAVCRPVTVTVLPGTTITTTGA